jgi:uncharacterized membrane protein YfcA
LTTILKLILAPFCVNLTGFINNGFMDFSINTPALLFPAISLLLLAYTNRFNVIANRIRSLRDLWEKDHDEKTLFQLHNLRRRVKIIRMMQFMGVLCMFGCILCMFLLFMGKDDAAKITFAISLLSMLISLFLSLREIHFSVVSLDIVLIDLEKDLEEKRSQSEKTESDFGRKYFH